jgi:hypothetical protein
LAILFKPLGVPAPNEIFQPLAYVMKILSEMRHVYLILYLRYCYLFCTDWSFRYIVW